MSSLSLQPISRRESRQPLVQAALFAAALVVSLALHAVLLIEFPAMSLGRPADWPDKLKPHPLVLGEVRALPDLPAYTQPPKFRPENPENFATIEPLQKSLLEELQIAAEGVEIEAPPISEAIPPQAAPPAERSALDFRQDILQIEQRVAADELAALPRFTLPAVERVETAPDITLPATAEAIAAAAAASQGRGDSSVQALAVLSQADRKSVV